MELFEQGMREAMTVRARNGTLRLHKWIGRTWLTQGTPRCLARIPSSWFGRAYTTLRLDLLDPAWPGILVGYSR
jgi:hypothetical protein